MLSQPWRAPCLRALASSLAGQKHGRTIPITGHKLPDSPNGNYETFRRHPPHPSDHSPLISHVERTNRAFHEEVQRLLRVTRCNVEMYSTKAKIRRRTIASFHSFDTKSRDSLLVISCI